MVSIFKSEKIGASSFVYLCRMIYQTEPLSQFRRILRLRPRTDRQHLLPISPEYRLTDVTTQHRNCRCTKDTLLEVRIQLVVPHEFKNLFQIPKMSLNIAEVTLSAAVDIKVIKVNGREVLKWSQHL